MQLNQYVYIYSMDREKRRTMKAKYQGTKYNYISNTDMH